jgi:hypothetical protein
MPLFPTLAILAGGGVVALLDQLQLFKWRVGSPAPRDKVLER